MHGNGGSARLEDVTATVGVSGVARVRINAVALVACLALAVVIAIGIVRVADDPHGVSSGGYSHDGMNAKVWTEGSAALRSDLAGSKLGAIREDGWVYTNHPPLILVETAVSETVFGVRAWAQRLPAWAGTITAVWLMALVLRREGFSSTERAVGLLIGFGTPMVFAYGAMLDTPVTSLPFGVACLLAWQRERDGDAARWERPLTVALAVLAGWQAALLAGITLLPRSGRTWRTCGAFVAAVGAVVAWQMWVHGSLGDLAHQFGRRSGTAEWSGSTSITEGLLDQARWLMALITPVAGIAGFVGVMLALRERRPVVQMTVAAVVLFPLATLNAFSIHDYWMYWLALPLCFGGARVAAVGRWRSVNITRLVLVAGLLVAGLAATGRSDAALTQDWAVVMLERD